VRVSDEYREVLISDGTEASRIDAGGWCCALDVDDDKLLVIMEVVEDSALSIQQTSVIFCCFFF